MQRFARSVALLAIVAVAFDSVSAGEQPSGTGVVPPADPSNLSVTVMNYGLARITWIDNSSDESGFIIERKFSGGSFAVIDSVGSGVGTGTRAFFDTTVAPNTTYVYRVAAYNGSGVSGYSPEGTGTTPAVSEDWTLLNGPTPETGTAGFYGVSFADSLNGIAVGNLRRLLKTSDGGDSWAESELTNQVSNATLWDIDMVAAPTAFVSGQAGFFARTTDGGTTWTSPGIMVDGSLVFGDHYGIDFLGASKGIVVGSSGVYATTDGGDSWTQATTGVTTTFRDIQFIDDTTAVVVGDGGTIVRSTNGGGTWIDQSGNIDWQGQSVSLFHAVSFRNLQNGCAVGLGGAVVRTTDGGASWMAVSRPTAAQLQAVVLLDEATILVVGPGDTTFVSHDSGSSWTRHATGLSGVYGLFDLTFQSPTSLVASGGAFHIVRANVETFLVPPGSPNMASAYLDGADDRIRVLDSAPANASANPTAYSIPGKAVTVEAWVFPMGLPEANAGQVIVSCPANQGFGADPYHVYALTIDNSDGTGVAKFSFMVSDGSTNGGGVYATGTNAVDTGRWYHVAGSYDGSTVQLCVDGVVEKESPTDLSVGSGSTGLYVGGITDGYVNGLVDEVRLWNISRTPAQLAGAKDITLTGNEPGLAGYWPMDSIYAIDDALVTPDLTSNRNDLYVQFDAHLVNFPHSSGVTIAPRRLLSDRPLYAVDGSEYRVRFRGDGWPFPVVSDIAGPTGSTAAGDSLVWTPVLNIHGSFEITGTLTNSAGSVDDTVYVYVDAVRRAGSNIDLDVANRGKLGAFGAYGKGMWYKGGQGMYAGDFSLVDRNDVRYAGGLFTTSNSFRPSSGFSDAASPFPGHIAFSSTFDDAWESNRIGVSVGQTIHYDTSAVNSRFVIIDYEVANASGGPIDDLFAQLSADFDVGDATKNLGAYDSTLKLTYSYEADGSTDSSYYGMLVLGRDVSGHAIFPGESEPDFIRSTSNLTTFTPDPTSGVDTRHQLTVGPVTLGIEDTATFRFAFLAGDNPADIREVAQQVRAMSNQTTGVHGGAEIPDQYALAQNYPNPFNPSTTIEFSVPTPSSVHIKVFNVLGQSVAVLQEGDLVAGYHRVQWSPKVATGLYFYRIEATSSSDPGMRFSAVRKMILLK